LRGIGTRESSGARQADTFDQCDRSISDFLLQRGVAIKRIVAGRIRL
jgi:hypothetical protein